MPDRVWVGSEGGPLLLLPWSLLPEWSGIDVPPYRTVFARFRWNDAESRASDYDRACDVDDYVGIIPVGHGEGLVLGDMPHQTTWLPRSWGGILARWAYADSNDAMELALADIPDSLTWELKGDLAIVSSPVELFNAAEPGMEPVLSRMTIELPGGTYHIRWARHAPDDRTAAELIELRRSSA